LAGDLGSEEGNRCPKGRRLDEERQMKAENLLAELNRLRKDIGEDKSDLEWLAVHHAFCFISYKMGEFQKYVEEQDKAGAFDEYEP